MREMELVARHTVVRHEQPSCAALAEAVTLIAHDSLADLNVYRLQVPHDVTAKYLVVAHAVLECFSGTLQRVPPIWTKELNGEICVPKTTGSPTIPSLPIVATSDGDPASPVVNETTPVSGK